MCNKKDKKDFPGFTLIEVLLVTAIIVSLGFLSAPVFIQYQTSNDVALARDITTQSLRRAQLFSRVGSHDTQWGVFIASGSIVVFQGASYASRDANYDEIYDISDALVISGDTEIVFSRITGEIASAGDITFTSSYDQSVTVSFNEKGAVF